MSKKEIDQMLDALESSGGVYTNEPETDPPTTEEPEIRTDPPSTDEPRTDAPETEAPKTEAPTTDEPATEPPDTSPPDEDALRLENEMLKSKLAERDKAPKTEAPTTEQPLDDELFLSEDMDEDDLYDLVRDKPKFNELLNNIYKKAVQTVRKDIPKPQTEPRVEDHLVTLGTKFFNDNPDLRSFSKATSYIFRELAEDSPDRPLEDIMGDLGKEVRSRLGLKANPKKEGKKPPPLPRKNQRRVDVKPKKTNPISEEIDEMNRALAR